MIDQAGTLHQEDIGFRNHPGRSVLTNTRASEAQKLIKAVILGGGAFLALPPLTYFGALLILAASALDFIRSLLESRRAHVADMLAIAAMPFLIYSLLRALFVSYHYEAIRDVILSSAVLILSVSVIRSWHDRQFRKWFQWTVVIVCLVLSYRVFTTVKLGDSILLEATVASSNPIAAFFPFAAYLIFIQRDILKSKIICNCLVTFFIFSSLYLLSTKGVLFCLLVSGVMLRQHLKKIFKYFTLIVLTITVSSSAGLITPPSEYAVVELSYAKVFPYIPKRLNPPEPIIHLGTSRKQFVTKLHEIADEAYRKQPIFGYGPDQGRFIYGRELGFKTMSHHTGYELLLNFGLIGFALFWVWLLTLFYAVSLNLKKEWAAAVIVTVYIFVHYPFGVLFEDVGLITIISAILAQSLLPSHSMEKV